MTPNQIQLALVKIRAAAYAGDDEKAHVLEDQLRDSFITFVASHAHIASPELCLLARMIEQSKGIEFGRFAS